MKIGLQTWGSDGDILPFLTLANGLVAAGHNVTVVYTSVDGKDYSSQGEMGGFRTIKANKNFSQGQNLYALTNSSNPLLELNALLSNYFEPAVEEMYNSSEELCTTCDLVIGHTLCHTLLTAAEKFNCLHMSLALSPMSIRSDYTPPIGPNLGKAVNWLLWEIGDLVMTKILFKKANKLRKDLGLSPIRSLQSSLFMSKSLTLVAASKALCPRSLDWGEHIQVCGFLNPQTDTLWETPETLRQFLSKGEPPVYMTFGTCMQFDLEKNTRLFIDAAKRSRQRAIIQTGFNSGNKNSNTSDVFYVESLPHHQVFPFCSAVVHHGGAGTTQAALIAGKPSILVSHAYDQMDWGNRLQKVEVAGKVLSRKKVDSIQLAKAINEVLNSTVMRQNAEKIGAKMRDENGVGTAIKLLEQRYAWLSANKPV
jgi:UDP:flavonoid glycosyltransferase YjiC (YdhE family)